MKVNVQSLSLEQTLLEQRRALDEAAIVSEADAQGNITFVNDRFVAISGYSREELIGQNHRILNSGKHDVTFFQDLWCTISQGQVWHGEVCNRKKDGSLYWVKSTIVPIMELCNAKPVRFQSIRFDITHEKKLEEKLRIQANTDALTGVFNRYALTERFSYDKSLIGQSDKLIAICLIDLDNFKPINDQFGHQVGDKVLVMLAKILNEQLREHGTLARLGGDEFVLMLTNLSKLEEVETFMLRLQHALVQPLLIEEHRITLSASIGISLYPQHDEELDGLLRHADHAMYLAKQYGKNRFVIFDKSDNQLLQELNQLHAEVRKGIVSAEFALYYQPKVNLRTGDVFGMEALLRWHHPVHGMLPPMSYLPIIEQSDLIIELGNWIIHAALMQIADWYRQGKNWVVSINIASYHLQHPCFFDQLTDALAKHPDATPNLLELEILETVALNDIDHISKLIRQCQQLGVHVALDDFGTGYSSLSYLKNLPIETIKIDQSFVRDMQTDKGDLAIIEAIISIGRAFGMQILAEGIESQEQITMLLQLGCDLGQGYGIGKPMPANKVIEWLGEYKLPSL